MNVTLKGWIHYVHDTYGGTLPQFNFHSFEKSEWSLAVMPHEFEVDIPDTFSPIAAQVQMLEEERRKAGEDYAKTVARINRQLSELLAIEHTS